MSITELRELRANHPQTFYAEWLKRDANGLAMARIRVSYEDALTILQRVKQGKTNADDGLFAKERHAQLLQRMLQKNWVSELDVKQYIIY